MTKASYFFAVIITLLFCLGLIMVFNTTSAEWLDQHSLALSHKLLIKQLGVFAIGLIIGYFILQKKLTFFLDRSQVLFWIVCGMLVCVFLPKVGMRINGAYRWVNILGISLQPSEFAKWILPLHFVRANTKNFPHSFKEFCKMQIPYIMVIGLVLIEPDNGTAFILLTTMLVLYFLCKIPAKYWVVTSVIFCFSAVILALSHPHVKSRLEVYLHPEKDILGKGHQPYQAKIATGSGGLWGRGLGESMQKLNYLPEARSDYIAAIYAEEFGFVGVCILLLLYMGMTFLGFYIAIRAPDDKSRILCGVFTFMIAFQSFLNLAIVSGLLPSKGTNLPFFSQGGSSLWANIMIAASIIGIHHKESRSSVWKKLYS